MRKKRHRHPVTRRRPCQLRLTWTSATGQNRRRTFHLTPRETEEILNILIHPAHDVPTLL